MAQYSQAFRHIGRCKAADYRRRRRQVLAVLALVLHYTQADCSSGTL
jgi:hypothetical protein